MKLLHWSIKLLQNNEVVVFLLPAPVHMRNTCPSLHYLEDFTLLQDCQHLIIRAQFVLLSFHEHCLLGLSMYSLVEKMLMVSRYLRGEPKSADQSHFYWSHNRNYRIVIISNSKSYHGTKIKEKDKSSSIKNATLDHSLDTSTLAILQHPLSLAIRIPPQQHSHWRHQVDIKLLSWRYKSQNPEQITRTEYRKNVSIQRCVLHDGKRRQWIAGRR